MNEKKEVRMGILGNVERSFFFKLHQVYETLLFQRIRLK